MVQNVICAVTQRKKKQLNLFTIKQNLEFMVTYYDTTEETLVAAGHVPGPKCRCIECNHLKNLEDRWILKMGTFYGDSGLNTRDEMKNKTRGHW